MTEQKEIADVVLNTPEPDRFVDCGESRPLPMFHMHTLMQYGERCAEAALAWLRSQGEPVAFQDHVKPWLLACFGEEIANDRVERNHRFLEEALELVQSLGCTDTEARHLVEYVYGRPIGDPHQEVGGVMVTLAALCLANDLDMHAAGEAELARIWTKVEQIRAKQAAKPKHSPLPQAVGPTTSLAPQPAIPDGYGETDFGFTFAGISLTEGDKRLMSMLIAALGTDHPAISDITSLLFAARTFAPAILGDWRPVETAPKDGTRIIVGGKSPNGNAAYDAVGQAYWRREVKYAEDSPRCDEPEGFYWASDNTRNGQCPFYITHWMPLPAAPEPSK